MGSHAGLMGPSGPPFTDAMFLNTTKINTLTINLVYYTFLHTHKLERMFLLFFGFYLLEVEVLSAKSKYAYTH